VSKTFTRKSDDADDEKSVSLPTIPAGSKNYMTPAGCRRLKTEYMHLLDIERPALVQTVAWAASNRDRSENGDYIYGKKRLREIDRRLRFLAKRMENSEVIDPVQRARKSSNASAWVILRPPFPAIRDLRPALGIASYIATRTPFCASTSAAIRPAGPAPITEAVVVACFKSVLHGMSFLSSK